jgi:hypothetical protein
MDLETAMADRKIRYEVELQSVVETDMESVAGVSALGLPARDLGLRTRYGVVQPSVTLHVADIHEYFHEMEISGGPTGRWHQSVRVFQPRAAEFQDLANEFFPGAASRGHREGMVRRLQHDTQFPARTVAVAADGATGRPMAMMMHDRALAVKDGVVTLFKKVRTFASAEANFGAALELAFCLQHATELDFARRALTDMQIDLPLEVAIALERGSGASLERFAELDRAVKAKASTLVEKGHDLPSTLAFIR